MIRFGLLSASLLLLLLPVDRGMAEEQSAHVCRYCERGMLEHHGRALGEAPPAASGRHYAPHRLVDVLHVKIDVTPDFDRHTIAGQTTLTFMPIAKPLTKLTLDAVDLKVSAVTASIAVAEHHISERGIEILFKEAVAAGKEASVTIAYSAEPKHGLYFRTPKQGYNPQDMHLWTQGETHEARHWFPSIDFPNERFTSEVICRVPQDMVVISNGRQIGEQIDAATKLKVSHWKQEKPHVNYLIALAAGRFKFIEAKHAVGPGPAAAGGTGGAAQREVPLRFYTPASQIEHARHSLKDTADMMAYFERETGAAYPWPKYDQVVVDDFHWGGMENTTVTILTDSTLHPAETEPIRSSQGLVAHELAHQWFGDYLTCRDWSHLWLNEGFATYYAHLYDGHKNGRDSMLYGLYRDRKGIVGNKDEKRPIVYTQFKRTNEQFDGRAYAKGSWVLHMLRTQLGEDLYRRCVSEYVRTNADRSVVTQDMQDAFEHVSGLSLSQFFDQWVYHARHPELTVTQSWDGATKLAKITVKQTHEVNSNVLLFSFPVKLRFRTEHQPERVAPGVPGVPGAPGAAEVPQAQGKVQTVIERIVEVKEKEQDFFIPLPGKPLVVRFDADGGVLADVKFDLPKEMLFAQLQEKDDVIGRLLAVEALAVKDDADTVAALARALTTDPFWGVRVEASRALRKIQRDDARQALVAAVDQPDARVRKQIVDDLGSIFHPEAKAALLRLIEKGDPHIDILAEAVEGLGRFNGDDVPLRLIAALKSNSYRQAVMLGAVRGMRRLDDPAMIEPLMSALKAREAELRSRDFGDALDALGFLARHQSERSPVRVFLTGYVNHPRRDLQVRAIRALASLNDPRAIAAVEPFETGNDDDPVSRAAKDALKLLRESKAAPVELKDLRGEVEQLKKVNDSLRKDFDELKKKLEASKN